MIVVDELKNLFRKFFKIFKTFILFFYYIFERMMENSGEIKTVVSSVIDKVMKIISEIINLFTV